MKKTTEMHIELCKEEIENLSPSEKHVVLDSLRDVKRNSDLVDEYLTEAFRNGEFAKCEVEACKNCLKHEVPGILKEMRKQQEAEK